MNLQNNAHRIELLKEFKKLTGISVKFDGLLSAATGVIQIDIIELDERLEKASQNDKAKYDHEKCTYGNRKNVSMSAYIGYRYGKRAREIIQLLAKPIHSNTKTKENGTQVTV